MTVLELKKALDDLIKEGKEDVEVYFNTEAACFDYHIVKIESVTFCEELIDKHVILNCDNKLYNYKP